MRKITDMVLIFTLCCSFCACSTGTNYNIRGGYDCNRSALSYE